MENIDKKDIISELKAMNNEDDAARRIFSWFDERKKDSREMPVRVAAYQAGISDREARRVFRALEQLGCGRIIKGRGDHGETRMKWSVSVRSIAAAAMGKGQQVTAIKATPGETLEAEEQQASALPTGLVDHTFKLRADFDVVIRLPQDFTAHEADRLGKFLQALPLS